MGGCAPEVLDDQELMELFTPVLRADFRANETFAPLPAPEPLDLPIVAMTGEDDRDPGPEEVEAWRRMTRRDFAFHRFPGGHFYFLDAPAAVAATLEAAVLAAAGG
jgi:medium-chain acyl-[acyl-carrier-protein] hydrolase